jgi:hypothetical protein
MSKKESNSSYLPKGYIKLKTSSKPPEPQCPQNEEIIEDFWALGPFARSFISLRDLFKKEINYDWNKPFQEKEDFKKAIKLLKQIYEWTDYKETPWAKKTRELLNKY